MQLESGQLLQQLKPLFRENFEQFGQLGAVVSIWQDGRPVVDLYGGFCDPRREKPWKEDTLVLVWSATKGIGSACALHVLQEHRIGIDRYVASFGPTSLKLAKKKSRCRSCFRIKPGFARSMRELIYLITAPLSGHSR